MENDREKFMKNNRNISHTTFEIQVERSHKQQV